jgi:hypothetical protein
MVWIKERTAACAEPFDRELRVERLPSAFDIRHSKFEIHFFKVSLLIRLDARDQRQR